MTESGWYVRTGEGAAIAAAAEYLKGVDVDAALDGFEVSVEAVLHVNATHPEVTGVERIRLLCAARDALRPGGKT